jgi:hypothetical protein
VLLLHGVPINAYLSDSVVSIRLSKTISLFSLASLIIFSQQCADEISLVAALILVHQDKSRLASEDWFRIGQGWVVSAPRRCNRPVSA